MCGIFGVIHSPQAAEEIFLGLQNLQHRGQDGAGIVTFDHQQLHSVFSHGLVDIAFPKENFKKLTGHMGVGHTRYATVGRQDTAMLQPFLSADSHLAIAHNGNIVNHADIIPADQLAGCSDSRAIVYLLQQGLQNQPLSFDTLFKAVQQASESLVGSYSVIGSHPQLGLFAFRDLNGLRPLVMGQRDALNHEGLPLPATAFASESMALSYLGYTQQTQVLPGELVLVDLEGHIHRQQFTLAQPRHCMFEWVYFSRVESELDALSVYQARFQLGVALAQTVSEKGLSLDMVLPVPETSRIAAIAMAEKLALPFREVLIKNRYVNRTFILESQKARLDAIGRKLYPVASEIQGKKILVVDDSIVRGNTAMKLVDMLWAAGAQEIHLASTCPPIQYPCYYGIDFPSSAELLAGQNSVDDIPTVLKVNSVVYQTMAGLKQALNQLPLCTACLDGDYPTSVETADAFLKQRELDREVTAV